MLNRIVLAGGSGYLGQVLADYYKDKSLDVVVLSRNKPSGQPPAGRWVAWDAQHRGAWVQDLEGAELLINLCGKNVNCRYTEKAKAEILRSRLVPTKLLGDVVASLSTPPKLWLNLASATIYRHAEDKPQDEDSGEIGAGFSVDVCKAWEACFWAATTPNTKKIALRTSLVLGRADGVFPRLKSLVMAGLGGHQGTGSQQVSWIHEQEFARITEWMVTHGKDGNVYNCTSPKVISNRHLMNTLRKTYGIPVGLPCPQWLLEIGAGLIGTETELVLKSRWVYPQRLLAEGFVFSFPTLEAAIHDIASARV